MSSRVPDSIKRAKIIGLTWVLALGYAGTSNFRLMNADGLVGDLQRGDIRAVLQPSVVGASPGRRPTITNVDSTSNTSVSKSTTKRINGIQDSAVLKHKWKASKEAAAKRARQRYDALMGNHTRQPGDSLFQWRPSEHRRGLVLKDGDAGVDYLGVMLDAGRFYYPVSWIYKMIDYISAMGFNLLHFRITDDPSFNVQLQSRPELAMPAPGSNQTYTVKQLREIVQYADSRGIAVMPEIDVPGHAGAWGGSHPYLIVPCAKFICRKNFGVPLNISHPLLMPIIRDVLEEVKDIFTTAPFFHLGGDEIAVARPCYEEVGLEIPKFDTFEDNLRGILTELEIDHSKVVRWEVSRKDHQFRETRVGRYNQYWMTRPHEDPQLDSNAHYFVSKDLYMDDNRQQSAWDVMGVTKSMWKSENGKVRDVRPTAIIATAFELDMDGWYDRNVLGRLLAVAMGVSTADMPGDKAEFDKLYVGLCTKIDLPDIICKTRGVPMLHEEAYKMLAAELRIKWSRTACKRLVETELNEYETEVAWYPKVGALI